MKKSSVFVFGLVVFTCSSLMAMDQPADPTHTKSHSDGEVELLKQTKRSKKVRRSRSMALTHSEVAALLLTREQFLQTLKSPNPLKRVQIQSLLYLPPVDGKIMQGGVKKKTSNIKPRNRMPRTVSLRHLPSAIHNTKNMLISVPDGK